MRKEFDKNMVTALHLAFLGSDLSYTCSQAFLGPPLPDGQEAGPSTSKWQRGRPAPLDSPASAAHGHQAAQTSLEGEREQNGIPSVRAGYVPHLCVLYKTRA